ncbi:MAG: hypothetical protein WAN65_23640 [Candidatus Sulfotelmatobacter sp.]|jgi:hypothetical protein
MADKMENAEPESTDFYRRSPADAKEMRHSTDELVRRLELVAKIGAELKSIGAELARLGEVAEKIERVAVGLRELRDMENPPAPPPAPKDADAGRR